MIPKKISHRGNLNGPNPKKENNPKYLEAAIVNGFDVEIDVWYEDKKWWLGHDEPKYKVTFEWMNKITHSAWYHCKNLEALVELKHGKVKQWNLNYFWHQTDDYTLTSHGFVWTFPRKPLCKHSIIVLPEICSYTDKELFDAQGICSDNIIKYTL